MFFRNTPEFLQKGLFKQSGLFMQKGLFATGVGGSSLSFTFLSTSSLTSSQGYALTFSRGGAATQCQVDGWLTYAPENLLTNSEDLVSGNWTKTRSSAVGDVVVAPDGQLTADKLVEDTTALSTHTAQRLGHTALPYQPYTVSIYAKAAERTQVRITLPTAAVWGGVTPSIDVNLITGAITTIQNATGYSATDVGNGWWKITVSALAQSSGATGIICSMMAGGTAAYNGDGVSGMYLWGAQLDRNTTPRTYLPTGASQVYSPRFDYNPSVVSYPNQNLLTYSQQFDQAAWTKSILTVSPNTDTAPDNTMTASRLYEVGGAAMSHALTQGYTTPTIGVRYCFSTYLKAAERQYAFFGANGAMGAYFLQINLATGVATEATTLSGATFGITNAGNGWYRVWVSFVATNTTNITLDIRTSFDGIWGNRVYVGDPAQSIRAWGAQQEIGSSPTVYTPTTSTAMIGNGSAQPLGLEVEGSRTNLILNSNDLSQAIWNKTDCTVVPMAIAGPDGAMSAWSVTEGTTQATSLSTTSSGAYTAGSAFTASLYGKRGNHDWIRVRVTDTTGTDGANVWFNLATGTVGTIQLSGAGTAFTATIQQLPNAWYRMTVTGIPNSTATAAILLTLSAAANTSGARVDNGVRYTYGHQGEVGLYVSTYVATGAATATRSSDVLSMPTDAAWYNQVEGSVIIGYTQATADTSALRTAFQFDDGTIANRIGLFNSLSNLIVSVANATQATLTSSPPGPAYNTNNKVATAFKAANFAITSTIGATNENLATGIMPTVNILRMGTDVSSRYIWGWIRTFDYYNTRLPTAQLQAMVAA